MNIFVRLRQAAIALVLASLALGSHVAAMAQSLGPAAMPAHPKALIVESLRTPAEAPATVIRLEAPDAAAVDNVKRANGKAQTKRLQIGMNRPLPAMASAHSRALEWVAVDGGWAARWSLSSAQAKALRVGLVAARTAPGLEMRFAGSGQPGTVYGPFTEADLAASAGKTYWSPVLEGDTATVELFVPGSEAPRDIAIMVGEVSHLLASPADPKADIQLKAIGDSGFCEVNFVCRSASDSALAFTGNAVARMTFSDGTGTFLCTGTLLNSGGGQFVPYFYTADHCIGDQATASTLTTHWFYESTSCGADSLSPNYTQVPGGATLLFVDSSYDISFMRLNRSPPSGATFAGWDAAQLARGTAFTAIHHPAGDLKKVSVGTMGGYTVPDGRSVTFIQSNWNSVSTGVTEGGSSGSGIFTAGSNGYAFRGGLLGGPSSCTAPSTSLFDWYSRFDVAYQGISQYLAASAPTNYTALWWASPPGSENGWGVNIEQQGDIVFATLFTYDQSGNPMWLVMSSGTRQGGGDTFSGPLYLTSGSPFSQAFTGFSVSQVGTMTLAFSGPDNGTLSYTVNGIGVNKNITKQLFGPTGAATCTPTTGGRASATNYTDLWFNPAEQGWGINLTQQGNLMFATLFIYDASGRDYWLVMSGGVRQADGSFTGPLYQTTGNGAFNTQPWPGVTVQQVGSMTLRFGNGENGTLSYSVNGQSVTKSITRQLFSQPAPLCN
ncbi:MAG: trypsin-like serine peptidase [Betaproteobacteria bacterium]